MLSVWKCERVTKESRIFSGLVKKFLHSLKRFYILKQITVACMLCQL